MNKEKLINQVKASPSSIFTKEDVLALLEDKASTNPVTSEVITNPISSVTTTSKGNMITIERSKLFQMIEDAIVSSTQDWTGIVDDDSAEFGMFGREIILEYVEIDGETLARNALGALDDMLMDPNY